MTILLMPLPSAGFDPTEAGVPWLTLGKHGHRVVFATPDGRPARADPMLINGERQGLLGAFMRADANGRSAYGRMERSIEFQRPAPYDALREEHFDGLLLPGGHAAGMRPYLESRRLQALVVDFFRADKPVGAICHGVLLCARSRGNDGKSVLHGRKTTALAKWMERTALVLNSFHLIHFPPLYSSTVEDEVRSVLAHSDDFIAGPLGVRRDTPDRIDTGFVVRDRNYLSSRWAGDAHRFAVGMVEMLQERKCAPRH